MPEPTLHEKFVNVFRDKKGQVFSTAEIKKLILRRYPNTNEGSILPNDHAEGSKCCCTCVGTHNQILDRIATGTYKVR